MEQSIAQIVVDWWEEQSEVGGFGDFRFEAASQGIRRDVSFNERLARDNRDKSWSQGESRLSGNGVVAMVWQRGKRYLLLAKHKEQRDGRDEGSVAPGNFSIKWQRRDDTQREIHDSVCCEQQDRRIPTLTLDGGRGGPRSVKRKRPSGDPSPSEPRWSPA
jgi:hypothetical protein